MKRIILFFAVCLGLSVFQTDSVVAVETSRSVAKRDNNLSTRQTGDKNRVDNTRNTANSRTSQTPTTSRSATVSSRPQTKQRTTTTETSVRTRNARPIQNVITPRSNTTKKTTARSANAGKTATRTATRAAEINAEKISAIKTQDYSKCKTVYYDCMDEFCANKDTNLRRCACSSRIHEFDTIKKQLDDAEEKMMDFNQRLLMVGLDKEDAAAVNIATEGEIGYNTKDTSGSEKLLRKITDALNSDGDSKINNNLSAISLSLDTDSAWDNIDSLSGISTASKNGLALYSAAQPICIEMAKEVCSEHELDIIQNSYKLSIQQDCNTVAKSYDSKYNQAIEKIHESGALLDMSRLNIYQQRNSDDILTCKKKILDKISDSAVCGENLHKCLDVTGQYIDPSTGNAFLSGDLYKIQNLLTAPTGTETWATIPQNQQFVSFLNSKKIFLESATDQCQDIADMVWKDFLSDALGQIKLAQNAKIEEIRQSCTKLIAECKSSAKQSLTDFDARALSTFEVMADTAVNTICADVENSCIALLDSSSNGGTEWVAGLSGIAADISYEAIIKNCTTVGRDCIIQQCNGTGGNFALCNDFADAPRRAILKHNACWDEVLACVQQSLNLENINAPIVTQGRSGFYQRMYSLSEEKIQTIPRPCDDDDTACLVTEQIWGNTEHSPGDTALTTNVYLINSENHIAGQNKILLPTSDDDSTLLSWLAHNTGTTNARDSGSAYNCPINYKYNENTQTCKRMVLTQFNNPNIITTDQIIYVTDTVTNACVGGIDSKDIYGNCCESGAVSNGICVPYDSYTAILVQQIECDSSMNLQNAPTYYCAEYDTHDNPVYYTPHAKQMSLYCVTTDASVSFNNAAAQLNCTNGYLIIVDQYGNYMPAANIEVDTNGNISSISQTSSTPIMSYKHKSCKYEYTWSNVSSSWSWTKTQGNCGPGGGVIDENTTLVPKNNQFMITY